MILTNDGALGHDLTQPKKHVEKEYFARIDGKVTDEIINKFAEGLTLKNGEKARPGELFVEKTYKGDSQSGWVSEIRVIGQFSFGFRFSSGSLSSFNNRRD